jgi:PKD repeat protein
MKPTHLLALLAPLVLAAAAAAASGPPSATVGVASTTKSGLSLRVTPASGKLPLHVTFTLKAPRAVSWRLDFGDGRSESAAGAPPATVSHVYRTKGSFVARLSTVYPTVTRTTTKPAVTKPKPSPAALQPGSGPLITLAVMAGAGGRPRTIGFALATLNPGGISTWQVLFGDGTKTGGTGRPPASVTHTYARSGTYRAYVVYTDKGTASYIRYSAPAGGLPVPIP